VTDDVTWPPKVLWGSTIGYPSDSLASCYKIEHLICVDFIYTAMSSGLWEKWRFIVDNIDVDDKSIQESRAVAGNPRDAAVIFDPYIKTW